MATSTDGTIDLPEYPPGDAVGNCVVFVKYWFSGGFSQVLGIVDGVTITPSSTLPPSTYQIQTITVDEEGTQFFGPITDTDFADMVFPEIDVPLYIGPQTGQEGFLCSPIQYVDGVLQIFTGDLGSLYDYDIPGFEVACPIDYPGEVAPSLGVLSDTHKFIPQGQLSAGQTVFLREIIL